MSLVIELNPVAATAANTSIQPDDLDQFEHDGLFELVNGRLVEKPISLLANKVAGFVIWELLNWGRSRGVHVMPEQTYQCFPSKPMQVRRPDISVILPGRFAGETLPEGHAQIRPDVAIEVVSPNDLIVDLSERLLDYGDAGVPLVLVVNPEMREVEVRPADGPIRVLRAADTLTVESILPGFSVKVADLFPPAPAAATIDDAR